eukprot:TRINITY_DN6484_c0_g1_i1.p1 TRINITY_DN6484_c0_g1~~TRINITY_DN6484_c0_g1_i1.p1  ORF type:complete len:271 (-),score=69.00 TRINITY_DN6484_c0_g1_i1:59-871(-)
MPGLSVTLPLVFLLVGVVWHYKEPLQLEPLFVSFLGGVKEVKEVAKKEATKTVVEEKPPQKKFEQFTAETLATYKYKYLSILGDVFDVSSKPSTYGEGGGYDFFTGIDGSRAYATGTFTKEGLISELEGLTPQEFIAVENWYNFFKESYPKVGYLVGHFYDAEGKPTKQREAAGSQFKQGESVKQKQEEEKEKFPPCNSSWSEKDGKSLWCSPKSGGVSRNWAGLPRKYKTEAGQERCACIQPSLLNTPGLKVYDGCDPNSERCTWPVKK